MAYKSDTVAIVIKKLNSQYFLPAIQREFVWGGDRIISLFDSIMWGYPIGSFLFWQLDYENRDKWQVYKFVDKATKGVTHNELANMDGIREPTLVIDGQQRLAALLIGLRGTYTTKKKYGRKNDPDAWEEKRLYLDLLKDPKTGEDDDQTNPRFGFQFFENEPANSEEQYWLKVGHILDFDDEGRFFEFKQQEKEKLPDAVTKGQISVFEQNLERLYRAIWKDDVIVYYMEHNQSYDRALDIFIRANERGVPLSKSDLMLSIATSKWGRINARGEIYKFLDHINNELTHKNNLNKDFVMKTCLVTSDLPVAYRVQNFTNKNLSLIQDNWENIKDAIKRAVDLTNSFGIDETTLTSSNALIPIIYYFFKHPRIILHDETPFDTRNARAVRCWLTMSLLNNVLGGSSDSILASIRTALKEHSSEADFPIDVINAKIAEKGRTSYFDKYALARFFEITYGNRLSFLGLSLLYDDNNWGMMSFHRDHIFPQDMFDWDNMREAGFNNDQWYKYYMLKDRIGNLELLLPAENQEKSNLPFHEWIKTRDTGFKKRHLIPDKPELWRFENFEQFIQGREILIKERLLQLYGAPEYKER